MGAVSKVACETIQCYWNYHIVNLGNSIAYAIIISQTISNCTKFTDLMNFNNLYCLKENKIMLK